MKPIAKILGADVELGNIYETPAAAAISNDHAARLLLNEIEGIPGHSSSLASTTSATADEARWGASDYGISDSSRPSAAGPPQGSRPLGGKRREAAHRGEHTSADSAYDPQDWGRKYLDSTGGCAYIDLGHLEMCIPEVRSARDFVAYHEANLQLARSACRGVNARLPCGERIVVMANNSDRLGNSWGGHLNVLITRELWNRVFNLMHPSLFVLTAFQVSSILYTGQGKVGAENGKDSVPFQISQRGDFYECVEGIQTTYRRPIVNSRDEPHCGPDGDRSDMARLHVIFHDTTLTQTSNYLKAGVTQLLLALLETGWCDRRTVLADPLAALNTWGHDPDLRATALLDDGRTITAVDHQQMFLSAVRRFVANGDAGCVPEAAAILALWGDTLAKLERRDYTALAKRLDWVMKRELFLRAMDRNPALGWESPAIRAADLLFADLDAERGLYSAIAGSGGADMIVAPAEIERARDEPPIDTRAWARTMLLRHAGKRGIESINWDEIRLRPAAGAGPKVVRMNDPRRFTRAEMRRLTGRPRTAAQVPCTVHHDKEQQR